MGDQLALALTSTTPLEREPFVVHAGVSEAAALLDAWPNWAGRVLAVIGPEGAGKSHLAALWAERVGARPWNLSGPASTEVHPVVCEDSDREPAGEGLFHLINRAGLPGGGLLLTGRTPPSNWPTDVPDLRSRLNAIVVVEVAAPDEAGFGQLLREAFRRRGILPSDDLITFLARRVERSASGAREVAERLDQHALATGRPVSRAVAREFLGQQSDLSNEM